MDSQEYMMQASDALAEENLKEAERLFLLAAEADSSNRLAFYNLGLLASDQDNLEDARIYLEKALEQGESDVLYNNMGTLFFRRKDYKRAKEFYRKALDINPDYKEARENIALANFYLAMLS